MSEHDTGDSQSFILQGMTILSVPPRRNGTRLLAVYDLMLPGGVLITGCRLIMTAAGTVFARGPSGETAGGHSIGVQFRGASMAAAIHDRAVAVFEALTGAPIASATEGRGVVSNLPAFLGTSAGSVAQDMS